jgi:hypothetical protein
MGEACEWNAIHNLNLIRGASRLRLPDVGQAALEAIGYYFFSESVPQINLVAAPNSLEADASTLRKCLS